jgi:hypothetical protein
MQVIYGYSIESNMEVVMKQQYRLLVSVTLAIMLMATMLGQALAGGNEPPQLLGFWSTHTAYQVGVAFWADGQPHYAAFFSGLYCFAHHEVRQKRK